MRNLKKVVVITGASKGIGAACVEKFVAEGSKVIAIARDEEKLASLQRKVASYSGEMVFYGFDLSKLNALKPFCRKIIREHGLPSGVVFNAGYAAGAAFRDSKIEQRKLEMLLNFHSPCVMLEAFLSAYDEGEGGTFIGIGSLSSVTSFPGNASYAASKAALAIFWRSVYHEYSAKPHKFGFVMPGLTDTEMSGEVETLLPRRSPSAIAEFVYQNYLDPKLEQTFGIENKAALLLNRLAPRPFDKALKVVGSIFFRSEEKP